MRSVTITDPTEADFEAAYRILTGFPVNPGRAAKLFRLMSTAYQGETVFGTCDITWQGDRLPPATVRDHHRRRSRSCRRSVGPTRKAETPPP
jgi:hypothetical protein